MQYFINFFITIILLNFWALELPFYSSNGLNLMLVMVAW